jgi:hypothetical protein
MSFTYGLFHFCLCDLFTKNVLMFQANLRKFKVEVHQKVRKSFSLKMLCIRCMNAPVLHELDCTVGISNNCIFMVKLGDVPRRLLVLDRVGGGQC